MNIKQYAEIENNDSYSYKNIVASTIIINLFFCHQLLQIQTDSVNQTGNYAFM